MSFLAVKGVYNLKTKNTLAQKWVAGPPLVTRRPLLLRAFFQCSRRSPNTLVSMENHEDNNGLNMWLPWTSMEDATMCIAMQKRTIRITT